MQLVSQGDFLSWAGGRGIAERCAVLTLEVDHAVTRQWRPPAVPSELESFIWKLLEGAADAGPYWLWRPSGSWIESDPGPLSDHNLNRMVAAAGVPADFTGVIGLDLSEWRDMLLLVLAHYVFGWQSGTDIQVVTSDGRCILQTSHHGPVRVQCADPDRMAAFVGKLATSGYEVDARTV